MGGEKRDWFETVKQTAPQAVRVLRNLAPTFELAGIDRIDQAFLDEHAIRGIIWDVDGTLTAYHGPAVTPAYRAAAQRLFSDPGLRHVILSNSGDLRYDELGRMFPAVPILKAYRTPEGIAYRQRVGGGESWEGSPPVEGMRPIRKPSRELVAWATRVLGRDPGSVVMVGDQYWTDVAGANLGGVRSIRVPPVEPGSFPRALRVLQSIEQFLKRWLT